MTMPTAGPSHRQLDRLVGRWTAGPEGHFSATWDLREGNRYTYRMEVSSDGAVWLPFMDGAYVREEG